MPYYYKNRGEYFQLLLRNPDDLKGLNDAKLELLGLTQTPEYVYKYCSIETALKILETGSVLLKAPDAFNDPFDCLARIGVWDQGVQYEPSKEDLEYLKKLIEKIPAKFQLPEYKLFNDLRSSYAFAITCFTTNHKNSLMWSHYANYHKGVCLEFTVNDILDDVHPCYYTDEMPELCWRSDNLNLALIKAYDWQYEDEWRIVKKTIRPKMRKFGDIASQIYAYVHSDKKYTQADKEEWGAINNSLVRVLENIYDSERIVNIRPTKVYLGLNYSRNYENTITGAQCDIVSLITRENGIPLHKIQAVPNSFNLYDAALNDTEVNNLKFGLD